MSCSAVLMHVRESDRAESVRSMRRVLIARGRLRISVLAERPGIGGTIARATAVCSSQFRSAGCQDLPRPALSWSPLPTAPMCSAAPASSGLRRVSSRSRLLAQVESHVHGARDWVVAVGWDFLEAERAVDRLRGRHGRQRVKHEMLIARL